ncbi:MAG: DAK2 domain-containing protein [Candidatus Moduliflexus flocculans]|nr:DAK2 domain-containing protein [Candidatus Moduliflexus flocculans]
MTWLRTNQQIVNALNVFPVPDGDTGTNMVLTHDSPHGTRSRIQARQHFGKMAAVVAKGALMGARGNSGVILSQLWRGFARGVHDQETPRRRDPGQGVCAKRAIRPTRASSSPVEGTILTVAKEVAAATEAGLRVRQGRDRHPGSACQVARMKPVENTPELLPVLKQAGVVDSGGKGLFFILEGMLRHVYGESLDTPADERAAAFGDELARMPWRKWKRVRITKWWWISSPTGSWTCRSFYGRLEEMGTSIQVGEGEGMYRMHIHVPTRETLRADRLHHGHWHDHQSGHGKPAGADG